MNTTIIVICSIICAIILLVLIACIIAALFGYNSSFKMSPDPKKRRDGSYDIPNNKMCKDNAKWIIDLVDEMNNTPYETVTIKSFDNLTLFGRLIVKNPDSPIDICFHGWKSSGIRDFSGGGKIALENNHNLLLVDQRSQGLSEGKAMTFGILERRDVLSWVDFVVNRFGENVKIVICGLSMGAATVLMSTNLPMPANVKGFIADCPFNSPKEILSKVCGEDMGLPAKIIYPLTAIAARLIGHFNPDYISAAEAVKDCKLPILIVHGTDDNFVPDYMSKKIADANPAIQRETFSGADHGLSYIADHVRYENLMKEFYKKVL